MKKFLVCLIIVGLLMFPTMVMAQTKSVTEAGQDIAQAVRENPISIGEYWKTQVDFWGELLIRFLGSAKPNLVFSDGTHPGLQITLYEQPSWNVIAGKVSKYPEKELFEQPAFIGVEWVGVPLLSNVADIFKKLTFQALYFEKTLCFGLSYEWKD